jgi:hypothetical protein
MFRKMRQAQPRHGINNNDHKSKHTVTDPPTKDFAINAYKRYDNSLTPVSEFIPMQMLTFTTITLR